MNTDIALGIDGGLGIETAGFCAWPCFEEEHFKGWRLRFADGFTKRANSANAGPEAQHLLIPDIEKIEWQFQERGIPTVFRLSSLPPRTDIDALLDARGYRSIDRSLVMGLSIGLQAPTKSTVRPQATEHWLDTYYEVSGKPVKHRHAHLRLLQAMPEKTFFAVAKDAAIPVCCGIGVISGAYLGLFEIATRTSHQGQGLATQLCQSILAWGGEQGAKYAFLQVEEVNHRAIRIYEKLGFRSLYAYWYRVKDI
jgi:N-acetylglutamate synthase